VIQAFVKNMEATRIPPGRPSRTHKLETHGLEHRFWNIFNRAPWC